MIVAAGDRIINPYESNARRAAMNPGKPRHLVVAHFHLRPGGVRRVIETALPAVVNAAPVRAVTLATGEAPEEAWLERLRQALAPVAVEVEVRRGFLYRSETDGAAEADAAALAGCCTSLLKRAGGEAAVLWAHNLALGRNAPLAAAWWEAVCATGAVFLSHHHDFFFDNRWIRWPELVCSGIHDLEAAAPVFFPDGERVAHLAINRADHALLAGGFGARARWLANPVTPPRHAAGGEESARLWLERRTGRRTPFWLLPCRLLRRKNIAEAFLLTRWLRPGGALVTTGGITSADEEPYRSLLAGRAAAEAWPLDLSVMGRADDAPPVSALLAASEAVVLSSLQEGFGLPYLEAASAGRPMVARSLPNVLPDLLEAGLHVPVTYDEVLVSPGWFDADRERCRQKELWQAWRAALPAPAQPLAGLPPLLNGPADGVPFSRLTLTAQIEVLGQSPECLREGLAGLNPDLARWEGVNGDMPPAGFSPEAAEAFSPARFARNFWAAVGEAESGAPGRGDASLLVLRKFLAERLRGTNLYPLLFTPSS